MSARSSATSSANEPQWVKPGWTWRSQTCWSPARHGSQSPQAQTNGDGDPVARPPAADVGADRRDDAGELVPGHVRQARCPGRGPASRASRCGTGRRLHPDDRVVRPARVGERRPPAAGRRTRRRRRRARRPSARHGAAAITSTRWPPGPRTKARGAPQCWSRAARARSRRRQRRRASPRSRRHDGGGPPGGATGSAVHRKWDLRATGRRTRSSGSASPGSPPRVRRSPEAEQVAGVLKDGIRARRAGSATRRCSVGGMGQVEPAGGILALTFPPRSPCRSGSSRCWPSFTPASWLSPAGPGPDRRTRRAMALLVVPAAAASGRSPGVHTPDSRSGVTREVQSSWRSSLVEGGPASSAAEPVTVARAAIPRGATASRLVRPPRPVRLGLRHATSRPSPRPRCRTSSPAPGGARSRVRQPRTAR